MCNLDEPAPALLGSTLLANEERLDMLRPSPLSSGLDTLDREALDSGFRYGEITAVAGASGTGKTLLVYQAIASHLIASEEGEVALIATSEPPLARLRDILLRRLDQQKREPKFCQSGYVYQKQVQTGGPPQDVQSQMTSMLERVRLSRVFDFPGVAEAIGEFGARLDEEEKTRRNRVDAKGFEKARDIAEGEERAENSLSVEEDNNTITRTTAANPEAVEYLPASMIVIDNIANVVGSMMTKSQAHGQAILASCMRSLQHLTRRRNVCIVLVNAAAGLRQQNTQYHRRADDQASVFSSTLGKPALGKHFSYLIDTSVFLSTLPRSKEDADIAYNVAPVASGFTKIGLVEILKDRHGSREGKWSSFVTAAGIELQSISS